MSDWYFIEVKDWVAAAMEKEATRLGLDCSDFVEMIVTQFINQTKEPTKP